MSGRSIVLASWVTLGLFVVTIVPDAAGLHAFDGLASVVALGPAPRKFALAPVTPGRIANVTFAPWTGLPPASVTRACNGLP